MLTESPVADLPIGAVKAEKCECGQTTHRVGEERWYEQSAQLPCNYCRHCGSRLLVLDGQPWVLPAVETAKEDESDE